jgi:predicted dehydrogenase
VTAVFQHFQPDAYPKVEDEATIILSYPRAQAILEASWNWPYGRKDMQIYGESGALFLPDRGTLLERKGNTQVSTLPVAPLAETESNPVSYLAAVVRGKLKPSGLSSLETNLIVCEILDAAKESARTGRRIDLEASP